MTISFLNPVSDSFASLGDTQTTRLMRLKFPNADGPGAQLLIERLDAEEGLSRDFRYTAELLSRDARIASKDMIGKMVTIELARKDGSDRYFNGYVFEFRKTRADGGWARYEMVLGPWLAFLKLRKDNYLFHNKSVYDSSVEIFSDYPFHDHKAQLGTVPDPPITQAMQWDESDYNYLHRRWESRGWYYWYEHRADGHTLILCDDSLQAEPIEGDSRVRFHDEGGSEDEDAVAEWSPVRRMVPTKFALTSFDFKNPRPASAGTDTINQQGKVPELEVYEYAGAYGFKNAGDGDRLAKQRMEEIEAQAKHFDASGNCRRLQPGRWFELTEHYDHDRGEAIDRQFLVLNVRHSISNNYLRDVPSHYANQVTAIRKKVPWRPGRDLNSEQPRIYGVISGVVVGPKGEEIHCDEFGRVRVQFHFDREGHYDENASCWVRVASSWAGENFGFMAIPRIGQEVLVQFLGGNPDMPIVTGRVYNQDHMPPWQLSDQNALMGIRSRELAGGGGSGERSNHAIFDDTKQQLQLKLRSDVEASELTLGHNVRIDSTQGRTDQRGQGFELRSDGHGAVRAGKGLLISTEDRPNASAHMTDMGETVARLSAGRDMHEGLSEAAQQARAHETGDQDEVTKALKSQNDEVKGTGGDAAKGKFPEFQAPHITLASPTGIATTTAGSTHVVSNGHNALSSGSHTSIASGKSLLVSVKEAVRLFAYKAGMRLIAAESDIDIQALKNNINVLAKLDIKLEANKITISAKEEVVINGGTSYTRWNASGIENGTNGLWREHAAYHSLVGPKSQPVSQREGRSCSQQVRNASSSGAGSVAR